MNCIVSSYFTSEVGENGDGDNVGYEGWTELELPPSIPLPLPYFDPLPLWLDPPDLGHVNISMR
jgi:hypothetical protein